MKSKDELIQFSKKILVVIGILAAVSLAIWSRQIILSVILGIGIATIIMPAVSWVKNKFKVSNTFSAIIIYLLLLLITAGVTFTLSWLTSQQIVELWERLPELVNQSTKFINSKIHTLIGSSTKLEDMNAGVDLKQIATYTMSSLKIGFSAISGIALSGIISFYICANPEFYQKQLGLLLSDNQKNRYFNACKGSARILRSWFSAQLADMVILGILTSIGLLLVGFKYWMAIGLLTGILAIIPYFGVLTVAIVSVLISLTQSPENVYWVIAVFVITQQLEGGVILPYLMKEKVSLPEAPLIVFIVLMGFWFGLLGMLMAPPILAVGLYIINRFRGSKPDILVTEKDV